MCYLYDKIRCLLTFGVVLCLNVGLIANKRRWEIINLTIPFPFGWGVHIVAIKYVVKDTYRSVSDSIYH